MFTSAQLLAAFFGVICGSAMIALLILVPLVLKKRAQKKGSTQEPNDFMPAELGYSFVALMLTFLFATIAIFAYHFLVADYLIWFSVAMLFWYLLGYTGYTLQKIVKERKPLEKQ